MEVIDFNLQEPKDKVGWAQSRTLPHTNFLRGNWNKDDSSIAVLDYSAMCLSYGYLGVAFKIP